MTEQDNLQPDQQKHPNPPNPQPDQPDQHIGTANPQKIRTNSLKIQSDNRNKGFSLGSE